ncbi:hypothetical protein U6G28_04910 [Actinomycetaceae bacterium MB13-C1-2]|nr:hypothetical protein U6G28_04910 [Actinomycetaceae bacterium MB13-C1-2]
MYSTTRLLAEALLKTSSFADIDYSGAPALAFYWFGAAVVVVGGISFILHKWKK